MEPQLVPVARTSPTECALCKTFEGPFIDTGVDKIEGRILLCVSRTDEHGNLERTGCVEQIARLAGSVDKETHAETLATNTALNQRVTELESAIKTAGPVEVVSLEALKIELEAALTGSEVAAATEKFQSDVLAAIAELDVKRKKPS